MVGEASRQESTFVVRLWCEARPSDEPEQWRGTATNAITSEKFGFTNFDQLIQFLSRESGMEAPPVQLPDLYRGS